MKKGVIYLNYGTKCIFRLIVSIHSLRKYYKGNISVLSDGDESNNALNDIFLGNDIGVDIIKCKFDKKLEGKNSIYLKKADINTNTPYDVSVFLDADTLVVGDISELFKLAEENDFVVPQFTNWTTNTRQIVKRIKSWESTHSEFIKNALEFGPAVNCGVFAFKKDCEFAKKWCNEIIIGRNNFIPDETGMQVILHRFKHKVCDQIYNVSCKYSNPYDNNARIIHYHGRKHCRLNNEGKLLYGGDLWINELNEVTKENFLNFSNINDEFKTDRMFNKYKNINNKKTIIRDITIVTAVNPPYLEKFKATLPTWQLKPQLKNCELIVFHNGFKNPEIELEFIHEISKRKVTLIKWEMENADSVRELMLSAFVLGAPKVVKTNYWLKLDVDAYFNDDQDLILEHFYNYDLAGHKWKYTKPGKWICDLDDWALDEDLDGDSYLNNDQRQEAISSKRYGHRRIASYCCLHNTEFTKEAMEYAKNKLPVPSHDTYLWYIAERMPDRKWCWHSYKKLGCNNNTNLESLRKITDEIKERWKL